MKFLDHPTALVKVLEDDTLDASPNFPAKSEEFLPHST